VRNICVVNGSFLEDKDSSNSNRSTGKKTQICHHIQIGSTNREKLSYFLLIFVDDDDDDVFVAVVVVVVFFSYDIKIFLL
jgi:hypothetical protein